MQNFSPRFDQEQFFLPNIQESPVLAQPFSHPAANQSTSPTKDNANSTARSPLKLGIVYALLFSTPVIGALGITYASNNDSALYSPVANTEQTASNLQSQYEQAIPASASQTTAQQTQANSYEYELSLATGFLRKAVELSNKNEEQTIEDKDMIVQYLNEALEAANRAIAIHPENPQGYSTRGRVYQATATIKPEMQALANQDFAQAEKLGSSSPTQETSADNPIEHLPTQQTSTNQENQAIIAEPEDTPAASISAQAEDNLTQDTVTLIAGEKEVFVSYPQVTDSTKIYVEAEENPENISLYLKNKETGIGFTISAISAPNADLDITWKEVQ